MWSRRKCIALRFSRFFPCGVIAVDLQQYNGWALVSRLVGTAILMAGVLAFLPALPILRLESNAIYDDPENVPHHGERSSYGAGRGAQRLAKTTRIDPDNVKNLRLAWAYHASDIPAKYGSELPPLKIGHRVYQTRLGISLHGFRGVFLLTGIRIVRKPSPARHPRCPRRIQLPRFRRPAGRSGPGLRHSRLRDFLLRHSRPTTDRCRSHHPAHAKNKTRLSPEVRLNRSCAKSIWKSYMIRAYRSQPGYSSSYKWRRKGIPERTRTRVKTPKKVGSTSPFGDFPQMQPGGKCIALRFLRAFPSGVIHMDLQKLLATKEGTAASVRLLHTVGWIFAKPGRPVHPLLGGTV